MPGETLLKETVLTHAVLELKQPAIPVDLPHVVSNSGEQKSASLLKVQGKPSHKGMFAKASTHSIRPFRTHFLSFLHLQRINNFLSTIRLDFPSPERIQSHFTGSGMNVGVSTLHSHPLPRPLVVPPSQLQDPSTCREQLLQYTGSSWRKVSERFPGSLWTSHCRLLPQQLPGWTASVPLTRLGIPGRARQSVRVPAVSPPHHTPVPSRARGRGTVNRGHPPKLQGNEGINGKRSLLVAAEKGTPNPEGTRFPPSSLRTEPLQPEREVSLSVLASRKVQGKCGQHKIDILIFHLLSAINEEGVLSNSTPTAIQEDDF
ncbi:apoptosis-inducing factor 2 isoform X1 [Pontoporia blainvillei]|uniref:Apoptosis-inducing factor 2 isoform X1 n=1 Tax=Pontoporia blainvillei TaxID=48723 RepID=A0ABX0S4P3_PONBL|nr:apoptosis-inducing factor 2 isoform X1 [Pontoporia blainvillei]